MAKPQKRRQWRNPRHHQPHLQPEALDERLFHLALSLPAPSEPEFIRQAGGRGRKPSAVIHRLKMLQASGWIAADADGKLRVHTETGRLRLNPRGFGFVAASSGPDLFIPERWLHGAQNDDTVVVWVRVAPGPRGPEGRVVSVKERAHRQVVGLLQRGARGWQVLPSDPRLPTVAVAPSAGQAGDVVVAGIEAWPEREGAADLRGSVIEVLGAENAPGMSITALVRARGLTQEFPPEVMDQVAGLPTSVDSSEWVGRRDLRGYRIVTIDGSDAKDLDDAISLEPLGDGDGWLLGVHIADVSHYVPEDTALDREARQRGTSVYLVDRVIPMLPAALSNGIASLNPDVDRLTVSAWITLDQSARIRDWRFERSVIRSARRWTYEGVNAALAGAAAVETEWSSWLGQVHEAAQRMHQLRILRGAMDFDLPEARVVLDAQGRPVDFRIRSRGAAESLIEEFMLACNQVVAATLLQHEWPGLFRVHDAPGTDKLEAFRELIGAFGYRLPAQVTPIALSQLLQTVRERPEERIIHGALLRSMKQARYSASNTGHFGLALDEYAHFTSPIRRYPDLWVHRILTADLGGGLTPARLAKWREEVEAVAEVASVREREAIDAERESVSIKQIEYMADKIGQPYSGMVSGVAQFGFFVVFPNLIEGLVRVEALPRDRWQFDPVHLRLWGQGTGLEFRLGDAVEVEVEAVDRGLRRINLRWLDGGHRLRRNSGRTSRTQRHRKISRKP